MSLATKFTLVTSIIVIVTTLVLSHFIFEDATKAIKQTALDKGIAIADSLVKNTVNGIKTRYFDEVQQTFSHIAEQKNDIVYVMLVHSAGNIVVHNNKRKINTVLNDKQSKKALSANTRITQFLKYDYDLDGVDDNIYDISTPISAEGNENYGVLRIGVTFDEKVAANLNTIRTRIISVGAILLLCIIFFSFLLSLRITGPLRKLMSQADDISHGNFFTPVFRTGEDEIGKLGLAFSVMTHHLKNSFQKIEQLATTDGLTGIYNRRYFEETLEKELRRAKRFNHPVSLIILDIDYFKKFNDSYGHQTGDQVLKTVAEMTKSNARDSDIVARYGGEEFVAILPETDLDGAMVLAERLRWAVENYSFVFDGNQLKITISIGVAYSESIDKITLVKNADAALYKAKESGRNKVCTL